jgi:pimeloyl-ACP methyl ester carboxylesterase
MRNSMEVMRLARAVSQFIWVGLLLTTCGVLAAQNRENRVRNIVLVHGAWADGSGWNGVYDILVKDGYNVSVVQEPETTFEEDVAATKRVVAQQDGPCILVGHSYGGAVITEAGMDPSVVGLVYIAAHMPDAGENESEDGKRFPSDLAKSGAIKKTSDGFTYIDSAKFHELFAADLSDDQAAFMARSQVLNFADNFSATITTAAWRTKPSWVLVAGSDRTINPDLERWYGKRAKSQTVEVAGASHSVYVSHPKEVADVIERAARALVGNAQTAKPTYPVQDEIRTVFLRFVAAQNAHDADTVGSMIWDSPDFLWVSRGNPVRGSQQAIGIFRSYYKGTWRLEPDMTRFSVTPIADGVVQLLVPVVFSRGLPGQPPQNAEYLISQTLVHNGEGWHITTILPVADTQLK